MNQKETFSTAPDQGAGLPAISGREDDIIAAVTGNEPVFSRSARFEPGQIKAGFACALHMHQPVIPAGRNGELISNLQYMFEHPNEGDNHNAEAFSWCYGRMGEIIPRLVDEGCGPRIMLDYSGNLLWGLQKMGRDDILIRLKVITCEPRYQPFVEWLGSMWGHAVVPSTPIPDISLHIMAWRHQFASIFGIDAMKRVRGFSLPEMHLPNHPDIQFEFIRALKECGYRWLLVQEHSVENPDGSALLHEQKYIPNRLTSCNSRGETISITALIKTKGSDTKLVGQMQPYHEAKGLQQQRIGMTLVPSLVTQIADGENGGVMMNEFPRDFPTVWHDLRGGKSPGIAGFNGSEYLECIESAGVNADEYPVCQAINQHKIWQKVAREKATPEAVEEAIRGLKKNDRGFHMEGASWTNNVSWVRGYEKVLEPMNRLSAQFHEKFDHLIKKDPSVRGRHDYIQALAYNLLLQTSCFRYWGQGTWTEYAQELFRRGEASLNRNYLPI